MSNCSCISSQQSMNYLVLVHLGGQLNSSKKLNTQEQTQQKKLKSEERIGSPSLPTQILRAMLIQQAISVQALRIKISPIIVPINPPTYEKQVSILLKERVQVVVWGILVKTISAQGLFPEVTQQTELKRLGITVTFSDSTLSKGRMLTSVSMTSSSTSTQALTPKVEVKVAQLRSYKQTDLQTEFEGLILVFIIGKAIENSDCCDSRVAKSAGERQPGSIVLLHFSTAILNLAQVSEVFLPMTLSSQPRGGHSIWLMLSLQQSATISSLKLKWASVQGVRATEVMLISCRTGLQYSWKREMLKTLQELLVRSKPGMPTINMKSPSGLVVTVSQLGSDQFSVQKSELMISILTVLSPMLAKRMMKMVMTTTEVNPPVEVVYSLSPEYLTKLEVGKRSTLLRPFPRTDLKEAIEIMNKCRSLINRQQIYSRYYQQKQNIRSSQIALFGCHHLLPQSHYLLSTLIAAICSLLRITTIYSSRQGGCEVGHLLLHNPCSHSCINPYLHQLLSTSSTKHQNNSQLTDSDSCPRKLQTHLLLHLWQTRLTWKWLRIVSSLLCFSYLDSMACSITVSRYG